LIDLHLYPRLVGICSFSNIKCWTIYWWLCKQSITW